MTAQKRCKDLLKELFTDGYFIGDDEVLERVRRALSAADNEEQGNGNKKFALIAKIEEAESIFNSATDWEDKFSRIFSKDISDKIRKLRNELGISFEYYDPDTTYQEDVTAYIDALLQLKNNLER